MIECVLTRTRRVARSPHRAEAARMIHYSALAKCATEPLHRMQAVRMGLYQRKTTRAVESGSGPHCSGGLPYASTGGKVGSP